MLKSQRRFIAKAEQVEQDTGIELLDTYDDSQTLNLTFSEDDGIYHVERDGYRAAYDVSHNQSLPPHKQRANEAKVRQAWFDTSDLIAKYQAEGEGEDRDDDDE